MAPAPSGSHPMLDHQLAAILDPLARRADLIGMGSFNLGDPNDYRVPDRGLQRHRQSLTWYPTAALVVEIVSPDDESWEKLSFYASHDVDEMVIVDPRDRSVSWFALSASRYEPVDHSRLLDVDGADVAMRIDWPPTAVDNA